MTTHKLTAPNDATCVIGPRHTSTPLWMILGVAYTDNDTLAAHLENRGYRREEVAEIPAEHLQQVDRLNAYPVKPPANGLNDGANPDQKYMFTGADGHTPVDVRDIITGRVTA